MFDKTSHDRQKGLAGILAIVMVLTIFTSLNLPSKAHAATVITDATGLNQLRNSAAGVDFELGGDTYMHGVTDWTPIVDFKGTLDGNGHTIYGDKERFPCPRRLNKKIRKESENGKINTCI